jgi:lipopolysaccharide export system protein LptA
MACRKFLNCMIFALSVWVTGAAVAEKADRDQPINIEADSGEVDDKSQIARFFGNVVLIQGTLVLRADELEVKQENENFSIGIAKGNPAYFKQKREGYEDFIEGEAQRIEYDSTSEVLRMFTNAKLWRDGDVVHGDFITYDANTEIFEAKGSRDENIGGNPKRVKAIIQPKKKD